jgi:hypothetical protein
MWLDALDELFSRLNKGLLRQVMAISVSAQQHGSVYWSSGASRTLECLESGSGLRVCLSGSFAINDCPIWADSSTEAFCRTIEDALGGPERLAILTGSAAYERFTGPQIARIVQQHNAEWMSCERVSLVSSFASSLLLQSYAPIDAADASGMNLMDLHTRHWIPAVCECVAGSLIRFPSSRQRPTLSTVACSSVRLSQGEWRRGSCCRRGSGLSLILARCWAGSGHTGEDDTGFPRHVRLCAAPATTPARWWVSAWQAPAPRLPCPRAAPRRRTRALMPDRLV